MSLLFTRRRLAVLLCTAGLVIPSLKPALAQDARPTKGTVRLLTVGNSFSRNATLYLPDLAQAGRKTLIHHQAVIGGATMERHLEQARRHETDPTDPTGYYSTKKSLKQELLAEPWDYITIQQASIKSHDLDNYRPSAAELYAYIKRYAPGAEILVHQTWAYRVDDPRFTKPSAKPSEPKTQREMYEGLTLAYNTIARELNTRIIPSGDAMYLADTDPTWGFRAPPAFDPKGLVHPQLPDQTHSLHVGWVWRKQKNGTLKLIMDGHHANTAGEYLGACVFYEILFGESVTENPFAPKGMDAEYAAFLRRTAHRAVALRQQKTPGQPVDAKP
jgi:hypothetical protein